MNEPAMQQNPDGTWTPSAPIPLTDSFDVEVTGNGPFEWEAWRGMRKVATGRARTRPGLYLALAAARIKHRH